jgi:PilZ domain
MAPMNSGGAYVGPERRESPRYKVNFYARWGSGEWEERAGTIGDLSSGGCFVLTDDAVEEGQLVKIEIEAQGQKALTLWGHVAYWVTGTGFAVRFAPFAQGGARQRLEALLREAAR